MPPFGLGGVDPAMTAFQQRFGRPPRDEVEFQSFMGTLVAPPTVSSQPFSQVIPSQAAPPQFAASTAVQPQFISSQPDFGPAAPFGQPQPQAQAQPQAQPQQPSPAQSIARDRVRLGGGKRGLAKVPRSIGLSLGSQEIEEPKSLPGLGGGQEGGGIAAVMAEQARLDALSDAEAKRNTTRLLTGILGAAFGIGGGGGGGGDKKPASGFRLRDIF